MNRPVSAAVQIISIIYHAFKLYSFVVKNPLWSFPLSFLHLFYKDRLINRYLTYILVCTYVHIGVFYILHILQYMFCILQCIAYILVPGMFQAKC